MNFSPRVVARCYAGRNDWPARRTMFESVGPCASTELEDRMNQNAEKISDLLHEAGETHHHVFRISDGADDDWASWYADWLIRLSELPDLLGAAPVRSELVYMLVKLDKDYTAEQPPERWEEYYAERLQRELSQR
jgi:hypothetical protein